MADPIRKPQFYRKTMGEIARAPVGAVQGVKNPQAIEYIRSLQRSYQIMQYSGPPGTTSINPDEGVFYPIFYTPETIDEAASRKAIIQMLTWGGEIAEVEQYLRWHEDYTDLLTYTELHSYTPVETTPDDEVGDRTTGKLFKKIVDYPTTSADHIDCDFHACALSFGNMATAALSIYRQPSSMNNEGDRPYPEKFSRTGAIIRADNSAAVPEYGRLINYAATCPRSARDTIEAATRRCLFQWGHPKGVWTDEYVYRTVLQGFPWPVYPRNTELISSTMGHEVVLIPAVVISGNAGSAIKFTIPETSAEWEYELPSELTSPTLITGSPVIGDCLTSEAFEDKLRYCTVEIRGGESNESILLHTLSLWEWLPYPFEAEGPS